LIGIKSPAVALLAARMLEDKVPEHLPEGKLVRAVAARSRLHDVCADDRLDTPFPVRGACEVVAELQGRHLGDVLVFGEGAYFVFGEVAEREAIFKGQHECSVCRPARRVLISIKPAQT
jgi:hypothetical protein